VALLDSIFSARIYKDGVEYVQRKTIEFIGAAVAIVDDPVNERTQVTLSAVTSERINYVTVTATSYAFVESSAYKTLLCTNDAAIALVLPANETVPYDIGTVFAAVPMGLGQITFSGAPGVTLVSGGDEFRSARRYAPMFAQQTSANTWLVSGEKGV
jgi:hypothetical protein